MSTELALGVHWLCETITVNRSSCERGASRVGFANAGDWRYLLRQHLERRVCRFNVTFRDLGSRKALRTLHLPIQSKSSNTLPQAAANTVLLIEMPGGEVRGKHEEIPSKMNMGTLVLGSYDRVPCTLLRGLFGDRCACYPGFHGRRRHCLGKGQRRPHARTDPVFVRRKTSPGHPGGALFGWCARDNSRRPPRCDAHPDIRDIHHRQPEVIYAQRD